MSTINPTTPAVLSRVELSSACICRDCLSDPCGLGFYDDDYQAVCPACSGPSDAAPWCFNCFDDRYDEAVRMLDDYLNAGGYVGWSVEGSGVGWTRRDFMSDGPFLSETVVDYLTSWDGDFTVEVRVYADGTVEAVRYSHDEYGAVFTLTPFTPTPIAL